MLVFSTAGGLWIRRMTPLLRAATQEYQQSSTTTDNSISGSDDRVRRGLADDTALDSSTGGESKSSVAQSTGDHRSSLIYAVEWSTLLLAWIYFIAWIFFDCLPLWFEFFSRALFHLMLIPFDFLLLVGLLHAIVTEKMI